jgi:hypothetical protein
MKKCANGPLKIYLQRLMGTRARNAARLIWPSSSEVTRRVYRAREPNYSRRRRGNSVSGQSSDGRWKVEEGPGLDAGRRSPRVSVSARRRRADADLLLGHLEPLYPRHQRTRTLSLPRRCASARTGGPYKVSACADASDRSHSGPTALRLAADVRLGEFEFTHATRSSSRGSPPPASEGTLPTFRLPGSTAPRLLGSTAPRPSAL